MKKILIIEDNQQTLTHLSYIAQEINSSNKIYAFKKLDGKRQIIRRYL
jgi:hypothetical protein